MQFQDRLDAGRQLAAALSAYRGRHPLVLAIPRGAVPMGKLVADELQGELDVVLVRKIGAPFNPEYAVGAIDETGWIYRNPEAYDDSLAEHLAEEGRKQLEVIRRRRAQYTPGRGPVDVRDRVVIVVDDGLATGATMIAALHALRQQQPARLICAVPVAPPDIVAKVGAQADEVVCLHQSPWFQAVGQFYRHFDQVEDEEVIAVLRRAHPQQLDEGTVRIALADVTLEGELHLGKTPGSKPGEAPSAFVLFAHGSGSSRHSPRNRQVAQTLNKAGIGTLLFDMLTVDEDRDYERRFDIGLLNQRLAGATAWLRERAPKATIGYFGASTGAAAALQAAAQLGPDVVKAVVSRGGRPDLAGARALGHVSSPTLLIVGSRDEEVLALNREAQRRMVGASTELLVVPGATHLFEEPGTLEQVAAAASEWFTRQLLAPR
jgi:predicted phosphoribosyltransferase/predicted alpha/beta-hydrolase family hydrolase